MDDPRQRRDGQRNLQINRCRQDLDQHGAARERPHRPHRHPPVQSRYRFRLRSGSHHRTATRARRLPHHRRRSALGACALCRRKRGLLRPVDGPSQSAHVICRYVASRDAYLGRIQRRPGQRNLRFPRRRNEVDSHRRTWPASRPARQDRCRGCANQFESRLRPDSDQRPGFTLAIRRCAASTGRRSTTSAP